MSFSLRYDRKLFMKFINCEAIKAFGSNNASYNILPAAFFDVNI